MTAAMQPVPFIKRVRIKNFKSIESCDVELGPLTVLVGLNAAGKSNFLDALRFVQDALANGLQSAISARSGARRLWRDALTGRPLSIELDLSLQNVPGLESSNPAVYGFTLAVTGQKRFPVRVSAEWFDLVDDDGSPVRHATDDPSVPADDTANVPPGGPDLPLRALAARSPAINRLYTALIGMSLHAPDPDVMRRIEPTGDGTSLGERGERLGDVLHRLGDGWPLVKTRIDAYLSSVVPEATGIDLLDLDGTYSGVRLRMQESGSEAESTFPAESISDGTLRAAGVLAALFQPDSLVGYITAVCIDEPELGLHPSAAGMLFYALEEASRHVQVIVATQSGDLLHRDEIDLDSIRVVAMRDGRSIIGPVDSVTREIVERKLATVGERMRVDQILPAGLEDRE
jgi:AAA domain, putative AbiEii toxin, Type IV TA system/AAA ATPase domain